MTETMSGRSDARVEDTDRTTNRSLWGDVRYELRFNKRTLAFEERA